MTSTETAKPLSQDRAILLGLLGMIVVPTAIVVGTNSWTEPEAADWVRMALGSVIAALVSVVSAWWLAFDRRRAHAPGRTWFWGVASVVTLVAVSTISSAADRLTRLIEAG
ncbi:hypothetical protein [Rathayibacter sp. VKM Ac-2926]|uniref:hypothetical protein n=1 Tax=Rathayibacter sp. VKM Ac-2926 TaxID=2929477 RepID=UPI001FB44EDA|nr:hypothetical protein [Rathayibacter sp. VKM Ac-2926]MCJ1703623.1 hypothetical protein [Rathayibacter sp. VKM Ac-2926]